MLNVIFATIFTFLCMATALFMGIEGSLGFAFAALFTAFQSAVLTIAAIWTAR